MQKQTVSDERLYSRLIDNNQYKIIGNYEGSGKIIDHFIEDNFQYKCLTLIPHNPWKGRSLNIFGYQEGQFIEYSTNREFSLDYYCDVTVVMSEVRRKMLEKNVFVSAYSFDPWSKPDIKNTDRHCYNCSNYSGFLNKCCISKELRQVDLYEAKNCGYFDLDHTNLTKRGV